MTFKDVARRLFTEVVVQSPEIVAGTPALRNVVGDQQEQVADEARQLERMEAALATSIILDNAMPGWVYVDASDYLPRDKWRLFVSNDRQEWVGWLVNEGVEVKVALDLVNEAFDAAEKRASVAG